MNSNATMTRGSGRSSGVAKMIGLSLVIGLGTFIGVRVKGTLSDRAVMASSLTDQAKGGPKRAAVTIVHATSRTWRPTILITGTLTPIQDSDVGFKTGGRLQAVRVKVGDRVKAGQQLAALDVSEVSAQSVAASAGVRAAQVGYDMAKDAETRTLALFEQHAVSDAEHTAVQNRRALALAQLEQARAQAQLAGVGVSNGFLAAPFSGLVTRAPNGVGKIVGPGEPLFHLEDTSVLKLTATLTEADARLVEVGAEIVVDDADSEGEPAAAPVAKAADTPVVTDKKASVVTTGDVAPTAPRGHAVHGKVTSVLGSLDAQTRRVPMTAEIPNVARIPLLAGSFVRATVTSAREISVLVLPAGTLRPGSQDEVVVMANGKAHLARIAFTTASDGSLLVRSGLAAESGVVQSPSAEVREGDDLGAGTL